MSVLAAHSAQYGSTVLPGIESLSMQTNPNIANDVTIGSPYPQFVVMRGQKPTLPLSSQAVATVLGVTGSVGADIDDTNNFTALFSFMNNGAIVAAGPHKSYTADRGLLLPRQLTCNHQEDATLNFEALLYSSDGATSPLVIAAPTSLPTIPRDEFKHTLGPITIDNAAGSAIDFGCATSLSIDFGNNAQTRGCNSDIWDKIVEQPGIQPTITITGLEADWVSAAGIPLEGGGMTHANCVIYLRKRDASGVSFVADATAEHIKIDVQGLAVVTEHTGQGTSSAEVTLQITASLDGAGNAPIGINTASAIT